MGGGESSDPTEKFTRTKTKNKTKKEKRRVKKEKKKGGKNIYPI